jgi:hypothetical protein
VKRGASGSFSANIITANTFTGTAGAALYAHQATTATTATSAASVTGSFTGDVTGTQGAMTVATIGNQTAAQVSTAVASVQNTTNLATASTLVSRDANADASFRALNASMELNLTGSGSCIYINNNRIFHATGDTSNTNLFVGAASGSTTLTSTRNTGLGALTLQNNPLGANNLALGYGAGSGLSYGNNNIFIGNSGTGKESSVIRLGTTSTHTGCFIAGISGAVAGANSSAVVIDSSGRLATRVSSARYKKDIAELADKTEQLALLRPVSFKYKAGPDDSTHIGLIAEAVADVLPEMVVYGADGHIHTVAYDVLPILLLQYTQKLEKDLALCLSRLDTQEHTIEGLQQIIASYAILNAQLPS